MTIHTALQHELDRRERARNKDHARDLASQRAAFQERRRVHVEEVPDGTLVTIRVRSEGCAVWLFLCLVSLLGFAWVQLTLWMATGKSAAMIPGEGQAWWLGLTLALTALCWYRWPTRILLTRDAYAVYRWGLRRRVGPRSELSVRTKEFYGPRLNISVYRRWNYEFWGITHPDDRAEIDFLGCNGRI